MEAGRLLLDPDSLLLMRLRDLDFTSD